MGTVNSLKIKGESLKCWAKISQALLSHFSLLAELLFGKVPVEDYDSRALILVNLIPRVIILTT
jgi:hypothetical protein